MRCQAGQIRHSSGMSSAFPRALSAGLIGLLAGCGTFMDHPSGTGPFDSQGNYVEAWADNPSKWNGESVPEPEAPEPQRETRPDDPPPVAQVRESRPTPPQPQPKPEPKPDPKPEPRYHTVRKGDTLYGLSKRYGTTVGKIQNANNLRGTVIRIGERLRIPR